MTISYKSEIIDSSAYIPAKKNLIIFVWNVELNLYVKKKKYFFTGNLRKNIQGYD